jgi:hypothetical protein
VLVKNTADRPIQVGSHYHFSETNGALHFDRAAARASFSAQPENVLHVEKPSGLPGEEPAGPHAA